MMCLTRSDHIVKVGRYPDVRRQLTKVLTYIVDLVLPPNEEPGAGEA
jgi:hypothetical protein